MVKNEAYYAQNYAPKSNCGWELTALLEYFNISWKLYE